LVVATAGLAASAASPPRPFPLPSADGKTLAAGADQRTFHVPFGFARVAQFYRGRFRDEPGIKLSATQNDGRRVLVIKTTRADDAWAKAVVREGEVQTTVEVTPVLRAEAEHVEGTGRPIVELVLTRSQEVDRMVQSIEHTPDPTH
jgi:hypothetical protein